MSYGRCELEAVHGTRHVDVGEDEIDVLAFLKNPDRLIGVVSGENLVARSPKFTACEHVDEGFVLDHEYATRHWVSADLLPRGQCGTEPDVPFRVTGQPSHLLTIQGL